jgi:hypothetical protein
MREVHESRDRDLILGSPIKPAAAPAPAPTPIAPGIIQGRDGKLSTDLPEPSWAAPIYLAPGQDSLGSILQDVADSIARLAASGWMPAPVEPASILSPDELSALDEVRAFLGKELRW